MYYFYLLLDSEVEFATAVERLVRMVDPPTGVEPLDVGAESFSALAADEGDESVCDEAKIG